MGIEHLALWIAAAVRRRDMNLPLERWTSSLKRIADALNWFGSERGGMLVSVVGTREDGSRAASRGI